MMNEVYAVFCDSYDDLEGSENLDRLIKLFRNKQDAIDYIKAEAEIIHGDPGFNGHIEQCDYCDIFSMRFWDLTCNLSELIDLSYDELYSNSSGSFIYYVQKVPLN